MDFRDDERERGITMKSSGFSCINIKKPENEPCLLNFIDSPGHVDFLHEIEVASDLADYALIVIDISEGVRTQSREVIKQCALKSLKMILVLNKIDRILDIENDHPDCAEIYHKIKNCIEDVNAIVYAHSLNASVSHEAYFDPLKFNVIFASVKHKWAFE